MGFGGQPRRLGVLETTIGLIGFSVYTSGFFSGFGSRVQGLRFRVQEWRIKWETRMNSEMEAVCNIREEEIKPQAQNP